jgi:hypothetical protein
LKYGTKVLTPPGPPSLRIQPKYTEIADCKTVARMPVGPPHEFAGHVGPLYTT